jgi:glycerol-3-phosphate acyltransferase PlsX
MIKLAIDAMGGDFAPEQIVKGVNLAIKNHDDLELVLYGKSEEIKKYLKEDPRITIVESPRVIDMGEHNPIAEVRNHRDSSLVMAFRAVRDKEVDGVVTAGPTQCVIAAAHVHVGRIKGMKRCALCPTIPTIREGGTLMLDVGANTDIRPEHIAQYTQYANFYAQEVKGIKNPKIYLLNIGTEEGKGRELEQQTYELLSKLPINFCGNVESKEILTTDADIIVTDGFTGNVAMKAFEGTAKGMGELLKKEIKSSLGGIIGALFMKRNLNRFKEHFNPDKVGGANLFGVDGTIVKAHGSSNAFAFSNAITLAYKSVKGDVVNKMKQFIQDHPFEEVQNG